MYIDGVADLSNRYDPEDMFKVLEEAKSNGTIPFDEELPGVKQITSWINKNRKKVEDEKKQLLLQSQAQSQVQLQDMNFEMENLQVTKLSNIETYLYDEDVDI